MTAPLIPALAFAPLRAMAEASLTDEVIPSSWQEVRQPGGRIVTTWVPRDPEPGLMAPASAGGQNIRADQPSAAGDWIVKLRRTSTVSEGEQLLVKPYFRVLSVVRLLAPKPNEITRRALCLDVESNP